MATPSGKPANKSYIPTLDGLRAIAIVLVISSHATSYSAPPVWANGYAGVMIFFALSGYLITTHLVWEFDATGRISLGDFYLRRAFRILPPVFLYLAALGALSILGIIGFDWQSFCAALFFYANYADHTWAVGHFWSLSVEEHFYLLWPLLLVAFGVRKGWGTAVAFAVAVGILRLAVDHSHWLDSVFQDAAHGNFHSDLVFDTLLWGCCLAFFLRRPRRADLTSAALSTIIAITVGAMMFAHWKISQTIVVAHLLPAILVGAVAAAPHAPIGKFLELEAVRFIGRMSYSLYIWQQLFLGGRGSHFPTIYALAATFVCAFISYKLIEQPAIRFGRRIIQKRTQPTQAIVNLGTQR
jgi:peptidoglycan/LPS O-acetylase OafA/YrhL